MAISVNDSQRFARKTPARIASLACPIASRWPAQSGCAVEHNACCSPAFHLLDQNPFPIAQLRTPRAQCMRSSVDEPLAVFEGNLRNEAPN
ncbi:MAG: hypothetical protein H6R07_2841 [Proteobacteria bacterium]|nr:hypothetical protein [Pseudomonadota bacterium]